MLCLHFFLICSSSLDSAIPIDRNIAACPELGKELIRSPLFLETPRTQYLGQLLDYSRISQNTSTTKDVREQAVSFLTSFTCTEVLWSSREWMESGRCLLTDISGNVQNNREAKLTERKEVSSVSAVLRRRMQCSCVYWMSGGLERK